MKQGMRRNSPALVVSAIALFVALGGSVYAAKKARIDGRAIRAKSLPGNRLKRHSVPADRLQPRSISADLLKPGVLVDTPGSPPLTGARIDELSLGQVPRAAHAETADSAQSADDAQTALNAVNAIDAQTVNGHSAGCMPGTRLFAGACWQASASFDAATAPQAAIECAKQGGTLPEALQLAAFALQPDVNLDDEDEWSSELMNFSGPNAYGVVTVSDTAVVDLALSSEQRQYRCVIPLLT